MMDLSLHHHDIAIAQGDFAICGTDIDCIAQTVIIRLKMLLGEWFFNTSIGLPYFSDIFGHKRSEHLIRQLILQDIKFIPGVIDVKEFRVEEQSERKLLLKFNVLARNGKQISISETVVS